MKTKLPIVLTILILWFNQIAAIAQPNFEAEQRFNRGRPELPYVGYDVIRAANPWMEVFSRQDSGSWKNEYRYITKFDAVNPKLTAEQSTYYWDGTESAWKVNILDKYQIQYRDSNKMVQKTFVEKRYYDTIYDIDCSSLFYFGSDNLPDSEYFYRIKNGDSVLAARFIFDFNSNKKLTRELYYHYAGFTSDNRLVWDGDRLMADFRLISFDKTPPTDTLYKYLYQYDSLGRIRFLDAWQSDVQGSPYDWTLVNRIEYIYNESGRVATTHRLASKRYGDFGLIPVESFNYRFNTQGSLIQLEQFIYNSGILSQQNLVNLNYVGEKAINGYEYAWNGTDYNTEASYKYLFTQLPSGIDEPIKESNRIVLYPNPASTTIHLTGLPAGTSYQISTIQGEQVMMGFTGLQQEIDIHILSPGLYLVRTEEGFARFLKAD